MTWDFKKNDGAQPVGDDVLVDVICRHGVVRTDEAKQFEWLDLFQYLSWRLHDDSSADSSADNALINHGENKSQVDTENNDVPNISKDALIGPGPIIFDRGNLEKAIHITAKKQVRYQDETGEDLIDEWARTKTHDHFREVMWAMLEKYKTLYIV